jgi:nicotinate-nucleotide pyrophosphorylase (carboxylating)
MAVQRMLDPGTQKNTLIMPNTTDSFRTLTAPHPMVYRDILERALLEDIGRGGDLTTEAIVSQEDTAAASVIARASGRIAGMEIVREVFHCLDPGLKIEIRLSDGMDAQKGDTLAVVQGAARPLLTGERTALNFLARLSGIATATRDIIACIAPHYSTRVVCTRKTTPGLRILEKFAVRAGGGSNHRFGLDDAVLIKDNHIVVAGGVAEAIRRVRGHIGHMVKIEVEVDTLEQLEVALKEKIDAVLLDNMTPAALSEAVRMVNKTILTEASGGITPQTAGAIAATGVDLLSIGWLTHSAPALDLSLDLSFKL